MRTFSIVTAVITAILLAVVGYAAITTNVGVTVTAVAPEPASDQYEAFTMATTWAADGDSDNVIKFTSDAAGDIADYSLVYITVEINNWDFMPAEWVQVNVVPNAGDVLQIRQDAGTARRLGRTTFQAVILSPASSASAMRDVEVEYYILGKKYTARTNMSQAQQS